MLKDNKNPFHKDKSALHKKIMKLHEPLIAVYKATKKCRSKRFSSLEWIKDGKRNMNEALLVIMRVSCVDYIMKCEIIIN